jgi:hypothetical protein
MMMTMTVGMGMIVSMVVVAMVVVAMVVRVAMTV